MASVNQFSLFILLLTLSSSIHVRARESQFFNKIPSTTNTNDVYVDSKQKQIEPEQEQQPTFLPQNDDAYGLYGHETGQLPPAAEDKTAAVAATNGVEFKQAQTLPNSKYLPKNYNPVAYVTEPDITDSTAFNGEQNYAVNPNSNNYYYNGRNEETESRNYYPTDVNNRYDNVNGNNFYNGGNSFNSQPQGLSDTRFLENGKYFYDVNTERYNSNHPYEMFRGTGQRNYYGNSDNNAREFYGNQQQYQGEENFNMP